MHVTSLQQAVEPPLSAANATTKFANALVIDDDPLFQIIASEALLASGVEHVETVDDGVIGLEKIVSAQRPYDLAIVDLQMPNMTGVDVVRELGKTEFRGAMIIASSEDPSLLRSVESLAKLLDINILGVLGKPLDVMALHELINIDATFSAKQTR